MTEIKYKYIYDVFGMQIGVIPISVDEIDSKKVIDEIEKSIDNEIETSLQKAIKEFKGTFVSYQQEA